LDIGIQGSTIHGIFHGVIEVKDVAPLDHRFQVNSGGGMCVEQTHPCHD
jgi:hypothetical protein